MRLGRKVGTPALGADDVALWEALQSGNTSAWGSLFDKYALPVYRFCLRYLGDRDEAEDCVSETFLEVWRSRRTFRVREHEALPILFAIARRSCQKRERSAARHERRRLAAARSHESSCPDIAEGLAANDELASRQAWLRQQVRALPPTQRDVYELAIYGELPLDRVAGLLHIPVGTVKSRMARARQSLSEAARTHSQLERTGSWGTHQTEGPTGYDRS